MSNVKDIVNKIEKGIGIEIGIVKTIIEKEVNAMKETEIKIQEEEMNLKKEIIQV